MGLLAAASGTSNLGVALIAALAALGGALVGGGVTLISQSRQWRQERRSQHSEQQRTAYLAYLGLLLGAPDPFRRIGQTDTRELVQKQTENLRPAEAALMLDGSKQVRQFVQDQVSSTFRRWQSVADERAKANVALPIEERVSVVDIYVLAFNEIMRPVLDQLADMMAKDVHSG